MAPETARLPALGAAGGPYGHGAGAAGGPAASGGPVAPRFAKLGQRRSTVTFKGSAKGLLSGLASFGELGKVIEGARGAKEASEEEKTLAEARRKEMQAPEDVEGGMQNKTISAAVRRLWKLQRQLDELRSEADNREDTLQPLEVRGAMDAQGHAQQEPPLSGEGWRAPPLLVADVSRVAPLACRSPSWSEHP